MTGRVFDQDAEHGLRTTSLDDLAPTAGHAVTWIDLFSPSREELIEMQAKYGFHPLAIEDALKRRQRPKVDVYATHIFVVLYALRVTRERSLPDAQEITLFVTNEVVVTIRTDEITDLNIAAHRWSEHCRDTRKQTAAMLVYTLVDSVVDGYFPVIDDLAEEIEHLEEAMFADHSRDTLQRIFELKRHLLELRRVISPTRDVFNAFIRRELPVFGNDSVVYFQDVYDHIIRVTDAIDADRDILSSAVDVHVSLLSNEMNQTVRTLTAASIILMSLALIAGIYGMNFELMPELTWRYGYFIVLAVMATIGGLLSWLFRRLGWW